MNALIFGAGGQDGYYLAEACRREEIAPIAVNRTSGDVVCDVTDGPRVASLIKTHQPDFVFHLAAHSTTAHGTLFDHHETIAGGTLQILEAVRAYSPRSRVFITGSGLQFVNRGTPISEHTPFAATSPYAVARIHSVYAARYFRSLGVQTYVGYLFHHESPRRPPHYVSMMVALAARRIAAGGREPLTIGNVNVEKEWTFAGDVADAMLTLVRQDDVYEAAIGSGVALPISAWLEACFGNAGLRWQDFVRIREGFTAEYERLVSDPGTVHSLGWRPKVDLNALAAMMLSGSS